MKKALLCVALVGPMLVAGVAPAAAQASSPKVGVAVKVGVLGAGVDVAVPIGAKVNIRGGFSGFSLSQEFEDGGRFNSSDRTGYARLLHGGSF